MKHALILCAILMLAACGGGDADDGVSDTMPIDCKATPEVCR